MRLKFWLYVLGAAARLNASTRIYFWILRKALDASTWGTVEWSTDAAWYDIPPAEVVQEMARRSAS